MQGAAMLSEAATAEKASYPLCLSRSTIKTCSSLACDRVKYNPHETAAAARPIWIPAKSDWPKASHNTTGMLFCTGVIAAFVCLGTCPQPQQTTQQSSLAVWPDTHNEHIVSISQLVSQGPSNAL